MIRASILLLVACCIIPRFRHRSAAERHLCWAASMVAAAMLPILMRFAPAWRPEWVRDFLTVLPTAFGPDSPLLGGGGVDVIVRANGVELPAPGVAQLMPILWFTGSMCAFIALAVEAMKLWRLALAAEPVTEARHRA